MPCAVGYGQDGVIVEEVETTPAAEVVEPDDAVEVVEGDADAVTDPVGAEESPETAGGADESVLRLPMFEDTPAVEPTLEAWMNPDNWPALAQNFVQALIVLVVGLLVYTLLRALLRGLVRANRVPELLGGWLQSMVYWTVLLIFGLFALEAVGLLENVWGVISAVVALIAVGFVAVWSILSNVMCTFMLLLFRPFNIGDDIEILEPTGTTGLKGRVVHLNLMFTTLEEPPEALNPPGTNGTGDNGGMSSNGGRGSGGKSESGAQSTAAQTVAGATKGESISAREAARRKKILDRWEARQQRIDEDESRILVQVPNNTFFQKVIRRRPSRRATSLDEYLQKEAETTNVSPSTSAEPSREAALAAGAGPGEAATASPVATRTEPAERPPGGAAY